MPSVPSDEEFRAYNQGVISEFRANHGVVSVLPFPVLLLTTTGARTGRPATVPLGFAVDDSGRVFVVASKAGAPAHPAWFHNLRANPSVTVELGDQSFQARAVVTTGEERDRLYRTVSEIGSEYEKNTDRVFPVIRDIRGREIDGACGQLAASVTGRSVGPARRRHTNSLPPGLDTY